MDRRFTKIAFEDRKGEYDLTLFGYTETTIDPGGLHPNDPSLKSYGSSIPGMSVGIIDNDLHNHGLDG